MEEYLYSGLVDHDNEEVEKVDAILFSNLNDKLTKDIKDHVDVLMKKKCDQEVQNVLMIESKTFIAEKDRLLSELENSKHLGNVLKSDLIQCKAEIASSAYERKGLEADKDRMAKELKDRNSREKLLMAEIGQLKAQVKKAELRTEHEAKKLFDLSNKYGSSCVADEIAKIMEQNRVHIAEKIAELGKGIQPAVKVDNDKVIDSVGTTSNGNLPFWSFVCSVVAVFLLFSGFFLGKITLNMI